MGYLGIDCQRKLRTELRTRAQNWARREALRSYESLGGEPTVLFEIVPDGSAHGNFQPLSWHAIRENPNWAQRLAKPHPRRDALPESKRLSAMELDSSNSSDALLMNCFCFPGASEVILTQLGLPYEGSSPAFGYSPRLPLIDGTSDETEIDMRVGRLLVEAKLTEDDFTSRRRSRVRRYRNLDLVFNVGSLPGDSDSFYVYQLIRNVIAAAQDEAFFVVLIDARRPDLAHQWSDIAPAIRDASLRARCGVRTWQQVAAAAPADLRRFLECKYGL